MIKRIKCFLFFIAIGIIVLTFDSRMKILNTGTMKFKVFSSVTHMEKYCVIYDYWEAQKEYSEGPHITLVLHSTYSYLGYLEDQLKTWDGGISVSVFIPTPVDQKTDFVKILESQIHLRLFFSSISSPQAMWFKNFGKVSLHLFFKRKNFHRCPELLIPENMYSALGASLSDMKEFEDFTVIYPINAARNIARKGSKTKLFISGDIEQVYVKNFEPRMYQLAKKVLLEEKRKTVLVYRRFELDDASPMPQNKRQLRGLMVNKQAVEFHKYYNGGGHRIRNLHEWLDMVEDGKEVSIADEVLYRNKQWEPQFVADDRVPFHDERFPYRYKTNIHLGLHLCFMNFTFSVVSDLFSIHRGIVISNSPKVAFILSQVHIKKTFNDWSQFRRELKRNYPEMAEICPLWSTRKPADVSNVLNMENVYVNVHTK